MNPLSVLVSRYLYSFADEEASHSLCLHGIHFTRVVFIYIQEPNHTMPHCNPLPGIALFLCFITSGSLITQLLAAVISFRVPGPFLKPRAPHPRGAKGGGGLGALAHQPTKSWHSLPSQFRDYLQKSKSSFMKWPLRGVGVRGVHPPFLQPAASRFAKG